MVNHRVASLCAILSYLGASVLAAFHDPSVIRGVNVGGWLLIEQWITPSLFDSTDAGDEWTLCSALGKDKCLSVLQGHWDSFFTKQDFIEIKKAGLNALRIPVGYWAVDVQDYEPYVSGQYPYLVRAVNWAQEVGLKVTIDLHGAPGSQNGQDNSGLIGPVLFASNSSNIDRSLNVLRNLTQEFTKDIYGGVVVSIELLNEPRISDAMFPMDNLREFYGNATQLVQGNSSNPVNVTYHDAFWGPSYWKSFNPTDSLSFTRLSVPPQRLTLDTHQYYAFPPFNNLAHDEILDHICNISQLLKASDQTSVPYNVVGEWSLETGSAPNPSSSNQNKGDNQEKRTWLRLMFEAQLLAYSPRGAGESSLGWYFWTWKTEYDIDTWSYRLGLSEGYIPSDVSNASAMAYPVLDNGCIDAGYNYTAPRKSSAPAIVQKSLAVIWVWATLLTGTLLGKWII